jgi:hypothetical protein
MFVFNLSPVPESNGPFHTSRSVLLYWMQTYTAHQQDLFLTHHTQLLWFPSHGQVDVRSARKKHTIDGNKTSFTFPAAAKSKKRPSKLTSMSCPRVERGPSTFYTYGIQLCPAHQQDLGYSQRSAARFMALKLLFN